ncbi:MAG: transporter substrate-binding protein [Marmoricola sp.]|jgi:iron complex transport system substrate-binding protein|nr:transporter substrate-binding protein [Marmoricola sp.]
MELPPRAQDPTGAATRLDLPRRSILAGAVGLGAAAVLSGCGSDSPATTNPRSIVVKDQRGTTLKFDKPVRRIVTIPIPAAAIVMAVDQSAAHIVGMNDQSWTAVRDGIISTIYPTALHIAHGVAAEDFSPNIESILALRPDVVVQWSSQGNGIITPLENAGLPVLGVDYGTLDDLEIWLTMFSTMLGKPERGEAMNARTATAQDAMVKEAATRAGRPPRVLYFLRFADSMQVAGAETFNHEYIKLVGAENAAAEITGGFGDVDIEQVLRWDPDIVLLGTFDAALPKDIYDDPVWKDVSAVRSRRVYKVPLGGYRWDPPSQETPLMWRWLADIAFPTGAASGLRTAITDDYGFLYRTAPTPTEIDDILWMDDNSASASYGQFRAT